MNLNPGDVLIDRKTRKPYPIIDVQNGHVYFELRHKKVKRAMGQVIKHINRFEILKSGQTLSEDYAFYCPRTDRMLVLKKGTVFLGVL